MTTLALHGCHPTPLGSYLKALGIFRIVAEQIDPEATGWWDSDIFHFDSTLDDDGLTDFLLNDYEPAPLVSPWNRGSGFHPKDNQDGMAALERSEHDRFATYRDTITRARELVARPGWGDLAKEQQVALCRAHLPDEAVRWLDAAVVLTNGDREFPPLLGTGGNVGRLEFSNNFMQRLGDALALGGRKGADANARAWLTDALNGSTHTALANSPVGQYDPGGTGGANSDPIKPAGTSLVNPWDFVLAFEGALLFASGAARRMGSSASGKAAMPFMVNPTQRGYASSAEDEAAKGELWAPLWRAPASAPEVQRLLAEGRAEWGSSVRAGGAQQARSGLDFARAAASLGVDRGIDEFVRHSFLERHGQNTLAVPIGRFRVTERADDRVLLTGDLDGWMHSVRRPANRPSSVRSALGVLERSLLDLSREPTAGRLRSVIANAGILDAAVAQSSLSSSDASSPVQPLVLDRVEDWLAAIGVTSAPTGEQGEAEVRLAAALASQLDRSPQEVRGSDRYSPAEVFRPVTRRAAPRPRARASRGAITWAHAPQVLPPPTGGVLSAALASFTALRSRRTNRSTSRRGPEDPSALRGFQVGVQPAYDFRIPVPVHLVERFLLHDLDDARLSALLQGCLLFDFSALAGRRLRMPSAGGDGAPLSPAYRLLAPFYVCRELRLEGRGLGGLLLPDASWARGLAAGATEAVVNDAIRRLRIAGLKPLVGSARSIAAGADPVRLAAALAFPISVGEASALLATVATWTDRNESHPHHRASA